MVAELLAGDLLHLLDVLHDLGHDLVIDLLSVLIVLGAGLGGNGEALGNRQTDVGHLSQVCALAAQQLAHRCITLGKQIAEFFAHNTLQYTFLIIAEFIIATKIRKCNIFSPFFLFFTLLPNSLVPFANKWRKSQKKYGSG